MPITNDGFSRALDRDVPPPEPVQVQARQTDEGSDLNAQSSVVEEAASSVEEEAASEDNDENDDEVEPVEEPEVESMGGGWYQITWPDGSTDKVQGRPTAYQMAGIRDPNEEDE